MFLKCFTPKHLQNVSEPSTSCGNTVDVKCFILHVTTSYLQYVFNMLNHLQKCLASYFTCIQRKTFEKNICKNVLEVK